MSAGDHLSPEQFEYTSPVFHAETDQGDNAACCGPETMKAGTPIVSAPDGSSWHPEHARGAGYVVPTQEEHYQLSNHLQPGQSWEEFRSRLENRKRR